MSQTFNKVIILGNMGADPEIRYLNNGEAVVNVRVATSETWKDSKTGEKQERTDWHRITFFRKIAEIAAKYLKKGSKVLVEGSIKMNKYQDENGKNRYNSDIIATSFKILDSKQKEDSRSEPIEDESLVSSQLKESQHIEESYEDVPF